MVMESGFSSPTAADSFPAGLRVLVVDDDLAWIKILEKMLKKCSYEVTTCGLAREALKLLRERKDRYDIVISDVNMPDMDGFKLLELVGLEMDLPVIMMSVDGETSRVMKGVQHGACDYLLKPIRMKELRNIWQHVLRKRMHEVRDIEGHDSNDDDDIQLFRNAADLSDDGHFLSGVDQIFLRKRKDLENKHGKKDLSDPSSTKKPRVVWSVDLHQKFVKAVNRIGFDKVGPKKILDLMNVPWLTRENVASHLQKYRLYLSRLQKESELKSVYGAVKNSDQSPKDAGGNSGIWNPTSIHQAEDGAVNLRCPNNKPPVQSIDTKTHDIGIKGINFWPLTEPIKPLNSDISDVHTATSSPQMGLDPSLGTPKPQISHPSFDCPLNSQFAWSRELQDSPFKFECKPHQQEVLEMVSLNECEPLDRLPTVHSPQQHLQADLQQAATCFSPRQSVFERDNLGVMNSKILSPGISNDVTKQPLVVGQATGSLSHSKNCASNPEIFGPTTNTSLCMNNCTSQQGVPGLELGPRNHILESESTFGSLTNDLGLYLLQDDHFATTSMGFDNIGFSEYNFTDLVNEAPPICLYGVPRFDIEYLSDSMGCAVVDQGPLIHDQASNIASFADETSSRKICSIFSR